MRLSKSRFWILALCCGQAMAANGLAPAQVAVRSLPPETVEQALDRAVDEPRRYAVASALQIDEGGGSWDEPAPNEARWRLRIVSAGARNLAVHLRSLDLPTGASLRLHGPQSGDLQQPDLPEGRTENRILPLVRGSELLLEARMPAAARSGFHIAIDRGYHGFRSFTPDSEVVAKGYFGNAGRCNIDVACSVADNWRSEIRSAVLISVDGQYLCSGTLMNNSAQDDRALILTAHHCDVTSSSVGSAYVYFNVQRSSCNGGSNGAINQNIPGSRVLADSSTGSRTDYTLFELAQKPPGSFNVHYAGWDTRSQAPACGVAVHHPSGDDKKISFYAHAVASSGVSVGSFIVDAWQVTWTRGTTEEGSSGSGLWSENHRLVGTLSGGAGACASSTSTENNGGSDYFARLDRAWSSGSGDLKNVLDAANTGCAAINGKNPGSAGIAACAADSGGSCGVNGDSSAADANGSGGGGGSWSAGASLAMLLAWMRRRQRLT